MKSLVLIAFLLTSSTAFGQANNAAPTTDPVLDVTAPQVPLTPQQDAPDGKPNGQKIDADLQALITKASTDASAAHALMAVLVAYDPYSKKQRPLIQEEALAALETAIVATETCSDVKHCGPEAAATISDTIWLLREKPLSPSHATRLAKLAETAKDDASALWLARRALEADPNNATAASVESDAGGNRLLWVGIASLVVGVAGIATSVVFLSDASSTDDELKSRPHLRDEADRLIADRDDAAFIGTISLLSGLGFTIAAPILWGIGTPDIEPESPEYLPGYGQ